MANWFASLDASLRDAVFVVGVAALTNVACALLGCYLVLRRMSLLGDALSHAVLPGLVVAFVMAGSLNIVYMLAGALAVGLLTTFLTQVVHRQGGVPADASMGVVFTSLFALGVVLIKRYGQGVDLDPDCVLYGQIDLVEFYTVNLGGYEVPRALVSIVPVLAVNVAVILLLWKELKISSFDPALATTMGINAELLFYLLMALVAVTTVASFEQVGSILVIAMLIVPGATAHLLTDRLSRMMLIATALAIGSAVLGYAASLAWNVAAAGPMAVMAGLFYLAAALASPRYGIVSTLVRNAQTSLRIVREDLLAMLYRLEELRVERRLGAREATKAIGAGILGDVGLWSLARRGELKRVDGGLQLTDSGRRRAAGLVRSHRLWEAYLVQHLGLPADHVHTPAERMEHFIGQRLAEHIVADLQDAHQDPHGRAIPAPTTTVPEVATETRRHGDATDEGTEKGGRG
ncbi:MAG: metal ABC transporter permease [Planctomycetia bacterium]|nr:metal ABC transporter permease [Planctomycetia bacterium]